MRGGFSEAFFMTYEIASYVIKKLREGCDQMHMEYDCLWQSAFGAQSGASPSIIFHIKVLRFKALTLRADCVKMG